MSNDSLYLCEPKIQFSSGGQSWENGSPELIKDLLQITIEESLHLPAMFTLVVHNSYLPTSDRAEYQPWHHEKLFEVGKKVKLGFISSTTQDQSFKKEFDDYLIEGEITAIEVHFNEKSEAPIVIRGYDISHRLHRGRYNRSFLNVTDSDIVKKIASETGIKPGKIDPSGEPHEYVFQENQTNMEFLRQRAGRIGFELFVQGDKINFCKPESQESLTLTWLRDISSFSTRITSAEQVNEVEVRYWDYTKKKLRTAKAKKEKVITDTGNGAGSSNSTKFNNTPSPIMTVVDKPTFSDKQAEIMAQALCNELGGEFVYADAKAQGNPKIRPGRVVTLEKMGDRFSGKYYITETRHHFSQRTYTTDFSVRGLRGGDLFTTISPQVHLQPGQTFLVGIVTDNKDPKGLGRVKVQFPTLTEEHTSNWARVVAPGVGKNRGFDCLPEVRDEVLVGFEHGDIHRPYVIGGVWNGEDAPPESVNDTIDQEGDVKKVRLRTFKTRTGHTLQFVEKDKGGSKTGIRVETVYGHKIYLNDSEKSIEIRTKDGHSIKMDDNSKSISIDSKGSISINANTTIDIKAKATITINGQLIRLN
ncbi:MAG: VgrG-related protein [Stigonema ocellatum SAG 48.90 = DSM 106950]|nr:VgrG-related protein [Stigonema ocellatum SAG 48.90 = DSM 106950]